MAEMTPATTLPNPEELSENTRKESIVLPVLGMTCAACQRHVEGALTGTPGVLTAIEDLMRHRAAVEFDSRLTRPEALVEAVRGSGYDAVLPRAGTAESRGSRDREAERKAGWKALITIVAGAAAMVFSMPLGMAASQIGGMDAALMLAMPWLYELPETPLRLGLLLVTAVLAVWAGGVIYQSAWKALLHGETNMNTLVSLGTGVAFFYSAYGTIVPGAGEVYFDSVLLILGFLLLGKWLEGRARHRALAAVDALAELQPATARVRRDKDGSTVEVVVPLGEVLIGDLV